MPRHVSLNNVDHANLKVRTEYSADLGDAVMSSPVFPHEFRNLQAHYPIVFSKESSGRFRPVALFGLEQGSNLFLDGNKWDANYVPMAIRMPPFLIGFALPGSGERHMEVHIDVDHPRVSETEGEPLFLPQGGQSDFLKQIAGMLTEIHHGETSVQSFCALLDEMELIEPFSLDVTLDDGTQGRLAGLYTIAEEKLYSLDTEALTRLQEHNYLLPVYMAVASISQFRSLIDRRNRKGAP